MFKIGETLVSEEIIKNNFHCNISACKGACCVEGVAGAPLEKNEAELIEKNFKKIEPYLSDNGKKIVKEIGKYIYDKQGEIETPLVNGKECVYVHYDSNGSVECSIEKAYNNGEIEFNKPLSCHLYPIRVKNYSSFTAVNYHEWSICSDACSLGKELQKPLYEFVKEALIRRFGNPWYLELEKVSKKIKKV
jgi:hypothetical protein